jgi:hypothetical protein
VSWDKAGRSPSDRDLEDERGPGDLPGVGVALFGIAACLADRGLKVEDGDLVRRDAAELSDEPRDGGVWEVDDDGDVVGGVGACVAQRETGVLFDRGCPADVAALGCLVFEALGSVFGGLRQGKSLACERVGLGSALVASVEPDPANGSDAEGDDDAEDGEAVAGAQGQMPAWDLMTAAITSVRTSRDTLPIAPAARRRRVFSSGSVTMSSA